MMNFLSRSVNQQPFQEQNEQKINLFVQDVIDFSSQYGKELSKSYTVTNIRSQPVHYPRYGDFLEACVLRTYGPWWLHPMVPTDIRLPKQAEPFFISQDFIGNFSSF